MIDKCAWDDPRFAQSHGALDFTLRQPVELFRKATFNNPLVGAAALGLLGGALGYGYGPQLDRLLSPNFGRYSDYDPEFRRKRKRFWGLGAGLLTGLGFLATQYRPNEKWYGMKEYAPMGKIASGYHGIPIADSTALIIHNPELSMEQKENALTLLHSFDAPPETPINGNDLVGQAIGTGLSAAKGAAVGFLTANALGLPNPKSTAILGAVSNTLGLMPALTLSTIFGN